jgi:hypothetical protein
MRFSCYKRGSVVAYAFDDHGSVGLRRQDGTGLLRTSDGIPRSVVDRSDVADVTAILGCVAEDLDRDACEKRGVEVVP